MRRWSWMLRCITPRGSRSGGWRRGPVGAEGPIEYRPGFPEWAVAEGAGAGAPGQAAGTARRDARGRFAAAPPPPLRGRAAERARGREEAATLAPWRTAIKRARLAKRGALAARRAARFEKFDKDPMEHPPGGVRGGQAVGGDGIAAVGGVGAAPAGVRAPVHPSRAVKVEISTKTQGGGGPGDSRAVAAGDGAAWGGRGIGIGEIVQGPCGVGTGAGDGGGGAAAGGGMGGVGAVGAMLAVACPAGPLPPTPSLKGRGSRVVDAPRPLVTWCGGGAGVTERGAVGGVGVVGAMVAAARPAGPLPPTPSLKGRGSSVVDAPRSLVTWCGGGAGGTR